MIQNIQREALVEMLLNSLEAERYVRKPLLLEVLDELSSHARFEAAVPLANDMLRCLDGSSVSDADFVLRVRELRERVHAAVRTSERREDPFESVARAFPRFAGRRDVSAA